MENVILATCINERKGYPYPIVGSQYYVKTDTLSIDSDGDAYANIYLMNGAYLGRYLLSHFTTM